MPLTSAFDPIALSVAELTLTSKRSAVLGVADQLETLHGVQPQPDSLDAWTGDAKNAFAVQLALLTASLSAARIEVGAAGTELTKALAEISGV